MRYAKRRDNNHTDIVEALRKANFEVIDYASAGHDIPDLLAVKPMHDGMAWIC
jgi:Holliday junction resolvase